MEKREMYPLMKTAHNWINVKDFKKTPKAELIGTFTLCVKYVMPYKQLNKIGKIESLPADSIVLALGYVSDLKAKKDLLPYPNCEVFEIGDCVKPRKIIDAVLDAYQLATSL